MVSDDEISNCSKISNNDFSCGECNKTFGKLPQLTRHHRETHVKRFRCTKCDYRCGRKGDMERHEATHAEPIPVRKYGKTPIYTPEARSQSTRSPDRRHRSRSPRSKERSPRTSTRSPRSSERSPRTPHRSSQNRSPRTPSRRSRSCSNPRTSAKTSKSSQRSSRERPHARSSRSLARDDRRRYSDACCQTEDEGDLRKRVRSLVSKLKGAGHDGGSVLECNTTSFKIPQNVVFTRKTERYISKDGELVEIFTEEIKRLPEES